MSELTLPLLLEPAELAANLDQAKLLIIDLCRPEQYAAAHIPGAVYLPYQQLMSGQMPGPGKLPPEASLSQVFSALGLTPDTHVVAYDDEGGGWAGRLIWTLDVLGHTRYSYLNGGLHAWAAEQRPLEEGVNVPTPSTYTAHYNPRPSMTKEEILQRLELPNFTIWDARSPEEYLGIRHGAQKNGHIPGAVNYEWTRALDRRNGLRIRNLEEVRQELAAQWSHDMLAEHASVASFSRFSLQLMGVAGPAALLRDAHLAVHELLVDGHLLVPDHLRRLVSAVAIPTLHRRRRAVQRPLRVARFGLVRVALPSRRGGRGRVQGGRFGRGRARARVVGVPPRAG